MQPDTGRFTVEAMQNTTKQTKYGNNMRTPPRDDALRLRVDEREVGCRGLRGRLSARLGRRFACSTREEGAHRRDELLREAW